MLKSMKVGQRIAFLRKEKGLTGEKLAECLGISAQAISKWENEKCLPETAILPKLAKALGCSIDSILVPCTFEDIQYMESITALPNIPNRTIATALKGASPQVHKCIFANMPAERAKKIRMEMESLGLIRISEVEAAQEEVLAYMLS